MKISKKCRYGLRALIDLSANAGKEYMVLGNIAERNGISPQYLEQEFKGIGTILMSFIRAPYIEKVYEDTEILAQADGKIVAARRGNQLVAFRTWK